MKKKEGHRFSEVRNRKAFKDYFVGDTYEAGLVLTGTEVKAIRLGNVQINDSFVRIEKGIPTLYHVYIDPYDFGNLNNHNPTRPRKLLLKQKEIVRLSKLVDTTRQSLIPIKLYTKGGLIKIAIALCKGKKQHDKREDIKRRDQLRHVERVVRHHMQR